MLTLFSRNLTLVREIKQRLRRVHSPLSSSIIGTRHPLPNWLWILRQYCTFSQLERGYTVFVQMIEKISQNISVPGVKKIIPVCLSDPSVRLFRSKQKLRTNKLSLKWLHRVRKTTSSWKAFITNNCATAHLRTRSISVLMQLLLVHPLVKWAKSYNKEQAIYGLDKKRKKKVDHQLVVRD